MSRTWLILDGNYLCHRAYHTQLRGLSHDGIPTGVLYGFFRDIFVLMEQHLTGDLAFCFDYDAPGLREQIVPTYKAGRRTKHRTPEEVADYKELQRQIRAIKYEYLTTIGYRNVFVAQGFEADDIIASIVKNLRPKDDAIIVSSDHDLYQLLSDRVIMWSPTSKKAYTKDQLAKDFGVTPEQWPMVKAIAGCPTDEVVGIKGIGEKLAAKYISGQMKIGSQAHKLIESGTEIWSRNLPLVKLPYPGTPDIKLESDFVSPGDWRPLFKKLGMNSLLERITGR